MKNVPLLSGQRVMGKCMMVFMEQNMHRHAVKDFYVRKDFQKNKQGTEHK
jgi:hypothetical protein